jgi:hypothetical protein
MRWLRLIENARWQCITAAATLMKSSCGNLNTLYEKRQKELLAENARKKTNLLLVMASRRRRRCSPVTARRIRTTPAKRKLAYHPPVLHERK